MKRFFCMLLFLPFALAAQIVDIKYIDEAEKYISADSLVVFDLDNTLIEPVQTLGSDQWFYQRYNSLKKEEPDEEKALEKALSEWTAIQLLTDVKLVEEKAKELISSLQKREIALFGMSTRNLELAFCTARQMKELELDLSKTAPSKIEEFLLESPSMYYKNGILYTNNGNKGDALLKFLSKVHFQPKNVVFINDKEKPLKEMDSVCREIKVPFIGLRYGYLDQKVQNISKEIAEIQMKKFGHLISDSEALELLHKRK